MSGTPKLYIAGMGMITPVGFDTTSSAAAVRAEVSAYAKSEYTNQRGQPITMASVPDLVFEEIEADIGEGSKFDARHYRVIKMAIIAIREACAQHPTQQPIPLIMAMPEAHAGAGQADEKGLIPLIEVLEHNCKPWIGADQCRRIYSGRAAGMEAIDFAFRYLADSPNDLFLIGGSDSYRSHSRLAPLAEAGRLKVPGSLDGFVPGEAGCFLLLTKKPELAQVRNGHIIALSPPGLADEPGHLFSQEPYRGDGLGQAFKKALVNRPQSGTLHSIYSSMNGESHWAKEYGVAYIRNRNAFQDPVGTEHPADCYGDLGAATAPALIALAAEHLFKDAKAWAHLVYSSSDHAKRGAIVVEKIAFKKGAALANPHLRTSHS